MEKAQVQVAQKSEIAEETKEEVEIIRLLSNSQFQIYEVKWAKTSKNYAMKLFPFENGSISEHFANEFRALPLNHKNVIKIAAYRKLLRIGEGKDIQNYSYLLLDLAYTDLSIIKDFICNDEKLVRTHFQQIIEGIEFLHAKRIAHMDLKPGNLLLGQDLEIKITDFDLCYFEGDELISGHGTTNYRAPEVIDKKYTSPKAIDIFSAGIILFVMCTGYLPYLEGKNVQGYNLFELALNNKQAFWIAQEKIGNKAKSINKDLRDLLDMMIQKDCNKRATLSQIKNHKWYCEEIYSKGDLDSIWRTYFDSLKQQNLLFQCK